ncbi:tyrosine-type recombinase/integrase [Pseudomonas entomophila]|uniref:tyrosine-type recombinase/integrase n=1 Tax=Pseudomonas entomophila TaxID=312306 RepID=UPI00200FB63B|nr:site-specific integrase [Pseudomonas entomophila]
MKNVLYVVAGYPRLYDLTTGEPIEAFNTHSDYICNQIRQTFSSDTPEQYTRNLARFFDFSYETGVMGSSPLKEEAAIKTIYLYYDFLINGAESQDYVIRKAAISLQHKPVSCVSANTYLAPVNGFLRLAQVKLKDTARLLKILTGNNAFDHVKSLPILEDRERSKAEMDSIHNKTLKYDRESDTYNNLAAGGIRGGKVPGNSLPKHFPINKIQSFLNGIEDPMHRCCAALMAAGGVRQSELWALRIEDIDEIARTIKIEDPNFHRNPSGAQAHKKLAYKGRTTAALVLFEPFKATFYESLSEYLAVRPNSSSDYLFVSNSKQTYGMPLLTCQQPNTTNKLFNRSLKKAQKRLWPNESQDEIFTSHSLRHFYGVWARNFVYIPGRPTIGLELAEIQVLMGHKDIKTTAMYAKLSEENIIAEIEIAERNKMYLETNQDINEIRAAVYIELGNELKSRMRND